MRRAAVKRGNAAPAASGAREPPRPPALVLEMFRRGARGMDTITAPKFCLQASCALPNYRTRSEPSPVAGRRAAARKLSSPPACNQRTNSASKKHSLQR